METWEESLKTLCIEGDEFFFENWNAELFLKINQISDVSIQEVEEYFNILKKEIIKNE